MALKVVENQSNFTEGRGEVVVTSDLKEHANAIVELGSADARRLAIKFAASQGVPDPRISGSIHHYPVDRAGNTCQTPGERPAAFHARVPITQRLV